MKTHVWTWRAAMVAAFLGCGGTTVFAAEPVKTESAIARVTVYPDRARVEREAKVRTAAGRRDFVFAGLPGWTDEESVRLALSPAGAGRIVDVQVAREHLAKSTDEEVRKAQAAVQEIQDQVADLDDDLKALTAQAQQVEGVRAFSTEQLPKDTLTKGVDVAGYDAVVKYVLQQSREIAAARRKIERQKRDLQPELSVRQRKLEELGRRSQLEQTTITVTVEAEKEQDSVLTLAYLLPGATWEATHELRANGAKPSAIRLASYAMVSQTTGEDWNGAEIQFSTQSPVETMERPEIEALLVGRRPTLPVAQAKPSSFSKAKQVFEGQNTAWFLYNNGEAQVQMFTDNFARQNDIQMRAVRVFQRLQKRGTTAHFSGEGRPTVRADGRLVRVPIGTVELAAAEKIVAVPEKNPNAVRTVELTNTSRLPVLPGRVALFQGESFLGHTDVDFVAENERFSLLLGLEDRLKIARVLDGRSSSLVRGERTRMDVAFDITMENLHSEPVQFELSDRVPVSQSRDVEVSRVRVKPDGRPDSQGLLKWTLTLAPGQKLAYRVEYTLEYPSNLLAVRQTAGENEVRQQAAPAAPADALREDIQKLEGMF